MVPDEEIAKARYLLGRECKAEMPMPGCDQSDQYCPKFHPWNDRQHPGDNEDIYDYGYDDGNWSDNPNMGDQ
jgi:hypothetical protein